jgi:aminoacrylate hydrolase
MPHAEGLWHEVKGRDGAPPLFLSPGLGGSAAYWTPNLEALEADHRLILYDHRGTGRSDRALQPGLTVDDMADDVIALADLLGIASFGLVGHAAGAAIGLSIALRFPERLDRLVAINGWAAPDPHFLRCMETRIRLLRDSGVQAFVRAQPLFLYPANWVSANHARLAAEERHAIEHFQGAANVEARIAALAGFDIHARLGDISADVLLVAATDDMLVPSSCSERMAEGMKNMRLETMTGGHACNVTEAGTFNNIVRGWLGAARNAGAI